MKTRILIADDEKRFLKTVQISLSLQGFDIVTVENGADALEELSSAWNRAEPYDLLITDIEMPEMTGIELVEELETRGFELPIVVISAYGAKPLVRFLLKKGVVGFIDKPFDPATLTAQVNRALSYWETGERTTSRRPESDALRRMTYSFAHELNNPLSGVIQGTELLKIRLIEDTRENRAAAEKAGIPFDKLQAFLESRKIGRFLENTSACGSQAAQIVENMVSLFCEESARYSRTDLTEMIEQSLGAIREWASKHAPSFFEHALIRTEIPDDLPKIDCVPSMLEQSFFNIMKNAVEAIIRSNVERIPEITMRAQLGDRMVSISISDNGPGMTEETRKSIFDPFVTSKKNRPTSGLGMWISRILVVQKHGGVLNVESQEGIGTTFTVCLPIDSATGTITNQDVKEARVS